MVKKNSKKITLFGSTGGIGNYLTNKFSENYEVIAVSRKKHIGKNINNITFSEFLSNSNYTYPKKKIDREKIFNSKAIILTIGSFKVSKNNLEINLDKSNFELNFKFLNYIVVNKKKFKSKCRVIVITSMNSEIPNLKSISYSMSKAKISAAIDNFKMQLKYSKISIENLMPGPIDTNMRNKKIKNCLSKKDIYETCNFLINLDGNVTMDRIKIFNKTNFFIKY